MTLYLLDTNILSDLVRNPGGTVASRLAAVDEADVCTSVVVSAELRFGALKSGSIRLTTQVERVLSTMDIRAFDGPADREYARVRYALEERGQPIGAYDLLIAAHALALDATVVTDNVREFSRVDGLNVENWLR